MDVVFRQSNQSGSRDRSVFYGIADHDVMKMGGRQDRTDEMDRPVANGKELNSPVNDRCICERGFVVE